MRNKLIIILVMLFVLCLPVMGAAAEKKVNIKGLTIGMPEDEARRILARYLVGDWKISQNGPFDELLGGRNVKNLSLFAKRIDDYGFAITRNNTCDGFISLHKETKIVTRITLEGEITEALYNPDKKNAIDMEVFVMDFSRHFGLPAFNWIPYGWQYESPNGYTITFTNNRAIDIKVKEDVPPKYKIE